MRSSSTTSWIRRIKTEYFLEDTYRKRGQMENLKDQLDVLLYSRVRLLQYAVFQPIFLQTLQAIGKCKRLQERLTVERRLCDRKHSQAVSTVMLTFIQIRCVTKRKVIRSVCISLLLKENSVMQCN